uniref:Aminoadipate-semialdehyde dehydrogenase n=1 Tax=Mastacembelus armatus TaxID=205130 RepID=A0A7N8Y5N9_9TELE
ISSMTAGTLQELVSAAALQHSDRAAVTYDSRAVSGSPVSLRYRELVELADELSHILREKCSPNNGVIGLYCCDDLFTPVWILGILKSPAAYCPLDPEAPALLSARVLNQCGLKYCAVKTELLQQFQTSLIRYLTVNVYSVLPKFKLILIQISPLPVTEHKPGPEQILVQTADDADLCDATVLHEDLAYVLHTSGTTGHPKIVRVPHKCILPNILHLRSLFQMSADDVVFLASPLTFDPSVVDIFLALSSGAQLLIVPAVIKKMPSRLAQMLFKDHKTTVLQVTPTLLGRFGRSVLKQEVLSSCSSLRVLALGGEICPCPALLMSWRQEENKTHIYNIYGITEVSCWASCYKIPESLLKSRNLTVLAVPLGTPLMDTVVEVRDEHGRAVTEGEGQVFVGGRDRVCLLDDEDTFIPGTMRATGDWVHVKDSQMYYLGRRDRLIKRHGKRVNLDSLQQLILSLPQVEACAVCLHEVSRLLAFIVASTEGGTGGDLNRLIQNQLSSQLPSYSVPDKLVFVPALCLTPHGKWLHIRHGSTHENIPNTETAFRFKYIEALDLPEDATIDEESNFLLSGGDSLKAMRLCEDILTVVGVSLPELLEIILDETFSDILHHVDRVTLPSDNSLLALSEAKRRHTDAPPVDLVKKKHKGSPTAEWLHTENEVVRVIRRGSEVTEVTIRNQATNKSFQADAFVECRALDVSLSWFSDTGRCVDASPVLLVERGTDQRLDVTKTIVFIGSHSHRLQALDLDTGSLVWERVLGDRIEASAAVSRCGTLVVIGCYDGCVYFLHTTSGETWWMFETGNAVKSCPAVDPVSGLVIVGSHDGHVYALNPMVRQCVWKHHCGGGAVFSSPYIHPSHRQLYVATLGGHLLCLNPERGDVLWSIARGIPFFSSPNCSSDHVMVGSVDGNICCFSNTGKLAWQFSTQGPVFSSPCLTPDQQRVLCGSHDGLLYCLDCADGSLVWTFQTSGKVYATPFVFEASVVGRRGILVGLASTDGTVWILDGENGQMLASHTLPGELFSSPVVYEQSLVIGCRNDFVYCLKLTVKEEI